MFQSFDKHFYFNIFTGWLILIFCGITIYALFHSSFIVYDDLEHLRAAYFVSLGDMPYRDFFEHHHPLLWYLWAPLIKILPHNTLLSLAIGRTISLCLSVAAFFYIFRIMKFTTKTNTSALIFAAVIFWTLDSFSLFSNIKPDVYARLCYFFGLYHLFLYFRALRFKNLQICAVSFTIAFMFIQTIVFQILPLILPIGYILYKHPAQIKNMLKAAVLPLVMIGAAAYYFYINDTLYLYYEKNWLFNRVLSKHLADAYYSSFHQISDILILAGAAVIIYLWRRRFNIYTSTIVFLFLAELLQKVFIVVHIRYCIYLIIFAAMLAAPLLTSLRDKFPRVIGLAIFAATVAHLLLTFPEFDKYVFPKTYPFYYLSKHGLEHEKVMTQIYGIYHPRLSYYWMYSSIEAMDNMFFEGHRDYNAEKLIREQKIRFIPSNLNSITYEEAFEKILTDEHRRIMKNHLISPETYERYISRESSDILELKDEYKIAE